MKIGRRIHSRKFRVLFQRAGAPAPSLFRFRKGRAQQVRGQGAGARQQERTECRRSTKRRGRTCAKRSTCSPEGAKSTSTGPATSTAIRQESTMWRLIRCRYPCCATMQFDCSRSDQLPANSETSMTASGKIPPASFRTSAFCTSERKQEIDEKTTPQGNAFIRICPAGSTMSRVMDPLVQRQAHLLTLHYCFDALHDAARTGATMGLEKRARHGEGRRSPQRPARSRRHWTDWRAGCDSFDSLALYQIERIRVKYRPAGFECSVPGLRNLYAKSCLPLRTTTGLLTDSIKAAAMETPKPASRDQLVISSRYPSKSR